jgi:hypothetical protein
MVNQSRPHLLRDLTANDNVGVFTTRHLCQNSRNKTSELVSSGQQSRGRTCFTLNHVHEDPATTHQYIEADLLMKEQALQRLQPPKERLARFKPRADLVGA